MTCKAYANIKGLFLWQKPLTQSENVAGASSACLNSWAKTIWSFFSFSPSFLLLRCLWNHSICDAMFVKICDKLGSQCRLSGSETGYIRLPCFASLTRALHILHNFYLVWTESSTTPEGKQICIWSSCRLKITCLPFDIRPNGQRYGNSQIPHKQGNLPFCGVLLVLVYTVCEVNCNGEGIIIDRIWYDMRSALQSVENLGSGTV